MTSYLSYHSQWLEEHNAIHTAREITQQPKLWLELSESLQQHFSQLSQFLSPLTEQSDLRIILTGAGTSAFVGDAAAPFIQKSLKHRVESIPTTDIVSNPEQYLDANRPTLLVSFARSGNSPESVAAVELVDQIVDKSYHLFLTCNQDGALSQRALGADNAYCVLMPNGSNDKSFAMTSSFSCMLMATLAIFGESMPSSWNDPIETVARLCQEKINQWQLTVKAIAKGQYDRLIVLGSGGFAGLAREASLKSLELSAGQVMTCFDSTLGFRHGPKFTINERALVIQMLSGDEYTQQYDLDLFNEIKGDQQALLHVVLGQQPVNTELMFELGHTDLDDAWLCFPYIVFCQMLAFEKSLNLGLGPDNPCPTGEVNRVVQGVTIYPYQ
ncbi:SIS domain-containing protein [Vibrio sonorensis]|uniref:SIS domain-containing protein n=1 Tax=Vibrio sonorensis TaxID=1004316 RepID=UPI0008D94B50|nr:SIS domain-containing protein [Vibrio sonorensis]